MKYQGLKNKLELNGPQADSKGDRVNECTMMIEANRKREREKGRRGIMLKGKNEHDERTTNNKIH